MLAWTRAGAVDAPTVLQIRVTRRFPGRVAAGAPEPTRSLSVDEIVANVRHFTVDRVGPRTRPCTALVLSGIDLHPDVLGAVVAQARAWGIERITVHLGRDGDWAAPVLGTVDAVAVTVASAHDAEQVGQIDGPFVTAVILLDAATVPVVEERVRQVVAARPDRVVLTWPFPPAEAPPPVPEAADAVARALPLLDAAGIPAGVKGLPACGLPDPDRLWRSSNRYYVDASHQRDAALLFFPEVARFAKTDVCRFCSAAARCDGVPARWLEQGLVGPLVPLE